MGAVLASNLAFSCDDGSRKGFHGWLRMWIFCSVVRNERKVSLLEAVSGSHKARYTMFQVLHVSAKQ